MKNFQRVYYSSVLLLILVVVGKGSLAATIPNTGKFWHVTDFHYDPTYWSSQLSCNAEVPNQQQYGDYWCDAPWKLVTSAIDAMAAHYRDVDFLIWTGDTVAHIEDAHLSEDINMGILQNLTDALTGAFPDKKVYASYGNHDYFPGNQYPPTGNAIYNRTAVMWQHWIEDEQQLANFRKGGYYTRLISGKLRVVALNTNLYYTSDKQTVNITDPADQMAWLTTVLTNARTNSEKVLLTAHIPPGVHTPSSVVWFQPKFNQAFIATLRNFTDVIAAMHYGHDHHDGFKVFYDTQGKAAVPLFVAPSVTPWRYKLSNGDIGPPHNPSIRLVTYDKDSGQHLDIQQLTLNLPQANSQGSANFTTMYTFTQHYNVPDLSAASLETLVTRMSTGNEGKKLLDDYFRFATTGADQGDRTCDDKCKNILVCGFKHYDKNSFDACVDDRTSSASGLFSATAVTFVAVLMTLANLTL